MAYTLWPYEETRFEFSEIPAVRLKTPWAALEIPLEPHAKAELESLILRRDEIPLANQNSYFSRLFSAYQFEPFFYIAPREDRLTNTTSLIPPKSLHSPKNERALILLGNVPAPLRESLHTPSWAGDVALRLSRLRGKDLYDATSLLTVFRRFHLNDKFKLDQTTQLREMIADIKDADLLERSKRFIHAYQEDLEERFDLMAVGASPLRRTTTPSSPLLQLMTETFDDLPHQNALASAAASFFLDDDEFTEAVKLAERLPPLERVYAQSAMDLAETMSKIFNLLSANLCYEVQNLIGGPSEIPRSRTPTAS